MGWTEALLLPKCGVAEDIVYCWHDIIKNKIQSFTDPFLENWLDDTESVTRFETTLKRVVSELEGFSVAHVAATMSPISNLPLMERQQMIARLDDMFRRGFSLNEIRERVRTVVEPLRQVLEECTASKDKSARRALLPQLRSAAATARCVLEKLPPGFVIYVRNLDD